MILTLCFGHNEQATLSTYEVTARRPQAHVTSTDWCWLRAAKVQVRQIYNIRPKGAIRLSCEVIWFPRRILNLLN